jgi:dicarboxylate/amino acid:cation (Na+ or H+) symporter, DAACS family
MGHTRTVTDSAAGGKKSRLHLWILLAVALGGIAGLIAQATLPDGSKNGPLNAFLDAVATPVGSIFLTMIFMVVVPLLFSALVLGVAEIGDAAKVGRVGVRALIMTFLLSGIAVLLALGAVNLVRPGDGIPQERREAMMGKVDVEEAKKKGTAEKAAEADPPVLGFIPRNPLLEATRALTGGLMPFMFFALIFGIALSAIEPEKALPVKGFLEGLFAVSLKIIEYAMKLAPIGVFFLVFKTGSLMGLEAFAALLKYAVLVLVVLAIHLFGTYSLVLWLIGKKNPLEFFRQMKTVMLTAFATSSSNATLPTALKAAEEDLGLPGEISRFVLTVGATANQNGTALFEGITIIFLCQLFQVPLTLGDQFWVLGMAIVAGIGTAGVPGGAWPMIGTIVAKLGAPLESIGIVLGIDRILDMSRTVLNVTGDMTIAVCVAQWEGKGTEAPETAQG